MTNNDELAMKLKAAAEKALPAIQKYESGEIDGDDALEMLSDFTDAIKPANILALLAERDADKNRIADLEARTVSVKLPKPHAHLIWIQAGRGPDDYWDDVAVSHSLKDRCCDGSERYPVYSIFEIQEACAAAGIKLEVGE